MFDITWLFQLAMAKGHNFDRYCQSVNLLINQEYTNNNGNKSIESMFLLSVNMNAKGLMFYKPLIIVPSGN